MLDQPPASCLDPATGTLCAADVARGVLGTYVWPFELLSGLLLLALVAAVAVARAPAGGREGEA